MPLMQGLWADLETAPEFSDRVIDAIHDGTEEIYGSDATEALSAWRDRMVRRIRSLKDDDPPPGADR